eukprot:6204682-Pleurochrysis_carterae.AAC.1
MGGVAFRAAVRAAKAKSLHSCWRAPERTRQMVEGNESVDGLGHEAGRARGTRWGQELCNSDL